MNLKEQAERGGLMLPEVSLEIDRLQAEVAHWKSNHASEVDKKRRLSAKYGAIMRKKPRARWRRFVKWVRRL